MPENIFRANIIAISGHRDYPDRSNLFRGLDRLRANEYLIGGARGVDSDALEYLGRTQPRSRRTVVLPNRLVDQPVSSRAITKRWSTNIIELRNSGPGRYQTRNQYLVNRSNHLRAFTDFRKKGGTYNTIQYAKARGRSYDVWPLNDFNREQILKKSPAEFRAWTQEMKNMRVNLQSVKEIILEYIHSVLGSTVGGWLYDVGAVGLRSLEGFWSR